MQWMEELEKKFSLEDVILEYGPGLAVPYFNGDDFEQPYGLIENLRDFILAEKPSHRIDIELGTLSGSILWRVCDQNRGCEECR